MANFLVSSTVALSLLAAKAIAAPAEHHHHHEERAAVQVTEYQTFYVTAGPDGIVSQAVPTEVAANTDAYTITEAAAAAHTDAPAPTTAPIASVTDLPQAAPVQTSSSSSPAAEASSSSAPAATSAGSSAPATGAGSAGALGVTYSPYKVGGGCKSSSEVAADIAQLSGFDVIRLYGTDCNQVPNVYNAKANGQKLFVGVFDMGSIQSECQAIHDGINGDWSSIHTVSIGNELVNSGQANPSQIGGYVAQGRSALQGLGYSGPVVSVDTFIATINNPELCQYSDYMAVNAHAFFDGHVTGEGAGEWALQQIQRVWTACGGSKSVLITESGWPHSGETFQEAVPSYPEQAAAVSALKSSVGNDVILYNAFNDLWRAPGYLSVEQAWGIYGNGAGN